MGKKRTLKKSAANALFAELENDTVVVLTEALNCYAEHLAEEVKFQKRELRWFSDSRNKTEAKKIEAKIKELKAKVSCGNVLLTNLEN